MAESETFQLDYERYAINQSLKKIAKKYHVQKVLEVPAMGLKALPSLYSLGFGEAGCEVGLVNPHESGLKVWAELNLKPQSIKTKELNKLPLKDNSYDFVWNFASLPMFPNYNEIIQEMKRVSSKYIMILCVDGYNVGSPIHRTLHKINNVPWTHGDKLFLFPSKLRKLLRKHGLKIIKTDVMNCPIWPDTVGFRDMKFHRMGEKVETMEWQANTVKYMKGKKYPTWIKGMHLFETFPMPLFIKHIYSHLYYVIAEKQ